MREEYLQGIIERLETAKKNGDRFIHASVDNKEEKKMLEGLGYYVVEYCSRSGKWSCQIWVVEPECIDNWYLYFNSSASVI